MYIERVPQHDLAQIADTLRLSVIRTIDNAQSGHLGGCLSSVELMTALYFGDAFHIDPQNPYSPNRDLVLNRGHLGPLRYSIFALMNWIDPEELDEYRLFGSRLPGHEDMNLTPGVDITPSGSLGMLLSYGVGAAIESERLGLNRKTIVFLGDGEEQEGNVGEAARHAANLKLQNLVCILDRNHKQLSRETCDADGASDLETIWSGYGWRVLTIHDGHNLDEINSVYQQAVVSEIPVMVIANTIKGKGLTGAEKDPGGYHTLSLTPDKDVVKHAIEAMVTAGILGIPEYIHANPYITRSNNEVVRPTRTTTQMNVNIHVPPEYEHGGNIEKSQQYYYRQLAEILRQSPNLPPIYFFTPDFLPAQTLEKYGMQPSVQVVQLGIREQHGIAMAHGLSVINPDARILLNYPDPFVIRALDQIYTASQSGGSNMTILGQISGLTQAQNGETHQGSGQSGSMLHIPGIQVLEPGDTLDLYNVLNDRLSCNQGVAYIRVHRAAVPAFPRKDYDRHNTKNYVVHDTDGKLDIVIVSSGFVTANAITAAKKLKNIFGIKARVVNVVDLKSAADPEFQKHLADQIPVFTVYNGQPDILSSLVSQGVMSTRGVRPSIISGIGFVRGRTGSLEDLVKYFGLDPDGIVTATQNLLK